MWSVVLSISDTILEAELLNKASILFLQYGSGSVRGSTLLLVFLKTASGLG